MDEEEKKAEEGINIPEINIPEIKIEPIGIGTKEEGEE